MSSLYGRKLSLFTGNKIHIKVNLLQSDVRKVVRNDSLLLLFFFLSILNITVGLNTVWVFFIKVIVNSGISIKLLLR